MPTTAPASSPPAPTPRPGRIAGTRCRSTPGASTPTPPRPVRTAPSAPVTCNGAANCRSTRSPAAAGWTPCRSGSGTSFTAANPCAPAANRSTPISSATSARSPPVSIGTRRKPAGIVGRGMSVGLLAAGAHPVSTAIVRMEADGGVTLLVSSTEVGQGARTVFAQIVAEELALPLEKMDRRLVVVQPGQRRERPRPALALAAGLGPVDEDAEHPRAAATSGPRSGRCPGSRRGTSPARRPRRPPWWRRTGGRRAA